MKMNINMKSNTKIKIKKKKKKTKTKTREITTVAARFAVCDREVVFLSRLMLFSEVWLHIP